MSIFGSSGIAHAGSLNAEYVMKEMDAKQQVSYISGVIEGLAYSRFLRDRPNDSGMNCIYNWHSNGGTGRWKKMEAWFARHPDKPVGVLLYVLIKKECGA